MTHPDIRCLCLDVDGVLTDGRLYYDEDGRVSRAFHIHDGLAIQLFRQAIGEVLLISGKESGATRRRADGLGITHVRLGSRDKLADARHVVKTMGLGLEHLAAMGDDLPDLPLLRACAYAIAPANAVAEVRAAARFVTQRSGGDGAVREAVEHLCRAAGRWDQIAARFGGDANFG